MLMSRFLCICIVLVLGSFGCSGPAPGLSYEQEILMDSLYLQEVELLQPQMDSLCDVMREESFRSLVDSISQQRLREIYQIID